MKSGHTRVGIFKIVYPIFFLMAKYIVYPILKLLMY